MRARGRGFTIMEVLIGMALLAVLILVVMAVVRSGSMQERQIMQFSDLQREARRAIELLQRDIRGMAKLEVLRRGQQGRLETLVLQVPTSEAPAQEVRYAYNAAARVLSRNGDTVLAETVQDVQLWPFDAAKEPQEIAKTEDFKRIAFFKLRFTLARAGNDPAAGVSGSGQRIFDFLIYPRLSTSRRKDRESRLNQADSRFAPERLEE